jgi:hypothetical protein
MKLSDAWAQESVEKAWGRDGAALPEREGLHLQNAPERACAIADYLVVNDQVFSTRLLLTRPLNTTL